MRVSLEKSNPYTNAASETDIDSPLFLTPLLNLFGSNTPGFAEISVSAVAAALGKPGFPLAIQESLCDEYPKIGALYSQYPSGGETPNNTGWTTFTVPPASKPTLIDMMDSESCGYIPAVTLGACLIMNNGQIVPVLKEAEKFVGMDPVWVPVVPDVKNFNQCQTLKGFAKVRITEVKSSEDPKYVKGDLLECIMGGYPDLEQFECNGTALVRDIKSGM